MNIFVLQVEYNVGYKRCRLLSAQISKIDIVKIDIPVYLLIKHLKQENICKRTNTVSRTINISVAMWPVQKK